LTFTSFNINSQENKIVEGRYNSVSRFIDFSKEIENLNQIPENIKLNLELYLKVILGDWFEKTNYFEGLRVNLEDYFKENPLAYKRGWLATEYQFVYLLADKNIGISKYYIKIDMDKYGQIISCNWPSKDFNYTYSFNEKTNKPFENNFQSNELMFKNAMKWAKANSVPTDNYSVELTYNKEKNIMCFTFEFLTDKRGNSKSFRVVEFNWLNGLKVADYSIRKTTVY
jgi:hypothetical protein